MDGTSSTAPLHMKQAENNSPSVWEFMKHFMLVGIVSEVAGFAIIGLALTPWAAVPLTANAAAASISTFVSVVQLTDAVTRKKGFNALNPHLTVAFAAVVAVNLLAAACFPYLGVVLTMKTAGVFFTCTVIGGAGLMLGLTALKKAGWL